MFYKHLALVIHDTPEEVHRAVVVGFANLPLR